MSKKFNILNWLVVGLALFGIISLIVLACKDYSNGTYSYEFDDFDGVYIEFEIELDDDEITYFMSVDIPDNRQSDSVSAEFKCQNGSIWIRERGSYSWTELGEIDAYTIELEYEGMTIELKNQSAYTLRTFAIISICLSGVIVLAQVGVSKYKKWLKDYTEKIRKETISNMKNNIEE